MTDAESGPVPHAPSCADPVEPGLMPVAEARARLQAGLPRPTGREYLPLRQAWGRILAMDVTSPVAVPGHRNSAMDGYALRAADLPAEGVASLTLAGSALAGRPYAGEVAAGECVRIMTGAVLPAGADTVIIQEQAQAQGAEVRVNGGHRTGDNVREAGEDIPLGGLVCPAGTRVGPAELGLLASVGVLDLPLRPRLTAAVFSTGDEVCAPGSVPAEGQIYDANRYTLYGLLTGMGIQVHDLGIIPDDPGALRAAFSEAASLADVVISSGGVSVGEADFIKAILAELGEVGFWQIAIKPGRPLAFGRLGSAAFIGLPGNPVAVAVTFLALVRPALAAAMGDATPAAPLVPARCRSALRKRPGRLEYQRGRLAPGADGGLEVVRTGAQGSGILSSMTQADCFIVLDEAQGSVAVGETVPVLPFHGLMPGGG